MTSIRTAEAAAVRSRQALDRIHVRVLIASDVGYLNATHQSDRDRIVNKFVTEATRCKMRP